MGRVGRPLALSALALASLAALGGAALAQTPPAKPAPALLEGVEMESAIVYEADPKTPHELRAAFAGKEHARWWIRAGTEGGQVRLLRLRSGEKLYALRLDSAESVELAGAPREEALAQLELRRALVQYESFEWKGEPLSRSASLGALGSLRARFEAAADARPREIDFLDPQGKLQDSMRAIQWDAKGPRPVPSALEFWHGETRVWKESVRRVDPMSYTREAFLPRDRLEGPVAGNWNVIQTPAPECAARRFELPAGATFESARKELERLRAEWTPKLATLGLELESRGTLELDEELRPRALLLRLSKVPEQLPEGFEKQAGRTAVGTAVGGFDELRSSVLRVLRDKVPAGAKTGAPYVRWALDPSAPKQVLLLLSWTTGR